MERKPTGRIFAIIAITTFLVSLLLLSLTMAVGAQTETLTPTPTADSSEIVFVVDDRAYLMTTTGPEQMRPFAMPAGWHYVNYPSWSPDGHQIAFMVGLWEDPDQSVAKLEIFVVDADGSHVTRLTDNDAFDIRPRWSPDGEQIAFVTDRDGNWEVYVMNADGTNQTNITEDDSDDGDWGLTWSPDGSSIAFVTDRGNRIPQPDGSYYSLSQEIYVASIENRADVVNLTERLSDEYCGPPGGFYVNPVWSPDSEYLAFSFACAVGADVFLLDVDSAVMQRGTPTYINLTQDQTWDQGAQGLDWSPDSSQLVFVSSPIWTYEQGNSPTNIFILDVQRTIESGEPHMVQLTNNTIVDMHYVNPAWRP